MNKNKWEPAVINDHWMMTRISNTLFIDKAGNYYKASTIKTRKPTWFEVLKIIIFDPLNKK